MGQASFSISSLSAPSFPFPILSPVTQPPFRFFLFSSPPLAVPLSIPARRETAPNLGERSVGAAFAI